MNSEDPETYLRRFAETQLRRLTAGEATAAECASHVDSVAVAFEETGALDREVTARVSHDLRLALAARSPGPGPPRQRDRGLAQRRARCSGPRTRIREASPEDAVVMPADAVLRPRGEDGDEDVYLLAYVASQGRAWFSVAARTSEPLVPRRHSSPMSARNPRALPSDRYRPTFAGRGMTAADNAGRDYVLNFSGSGGEWYLGRLMIHPAPPPDTEWLDVRCGGESARIRLRAMPPVAMATTRPLAIEPGEEYLLRRAEEMLASSAPLVAGAAPGMTGITSVILALRAVGLVPEDSPVPGQFTALAERLGAAGELTAEPGALPGRWAASLEASAPPSEDSPVAAASLAAVIPETEGISVRLAGLVTLPGTGTVLFGGLRASSFPRRSLWLRDDAGRWHSLSVLGSSRQGCDHTFQAAVKPPLGPETSRIEFYVTGAETEVRADIPLTWWAS